MPDKIHFNDLVKKKIISQRMNDHTYFFSYNSCHSMFCFAWIKVKHLLVPIGHYKAQQQNY